LLAASKPQEALSELVLAMAARPGDVPIVEQLTPALIAAGQKEAAEKLFTDVFTAYEEICKEFPQSAKYHNELAWLAARNDRRLDEALVHAQEAVRLRPDALNHVDTLAEVHFRRGDRDKAKELAKQNLTKEPNNKHFQEQLQRFEK
jgi:tetratricopeptide (TPR) repeat protein